MQTETNDDGGNVTPITGKKSAKKEKPKNGQKASSSSSEKQGAEPLTEIGRRLRRERDRFLKGLGDEERAAFLKLEDSKKEEFVEDSRELLEVDRKIAEVRGRLNPKVAEATKRMNEAIEAPHNGFNDQKADRYDTIVELYRAKLQIEQDRAEALEPLLTRQGELRKKTRTTFESMDQLRLDFS